MTTLWDLLPIELQQYIIDIQSASLIQKTYRKNRAWYFRRLVTMRRLFNGYTGRGYRPGDRVLLIRKDRKLQYGTINFISSQNLYYSCSIILADCKTVVYYNNNNIISKFNHPKEIITIAILSSWNYCVCKLCKKCDMCILGRVNQQEIA